MHRKMWLAYYSLSFQSVLVWVLFFRKIGGSEINIKMVPIGAVGLTVLRSTLQPVWLLYLKELEHY